MKSWKQQQSFTARVLGAVIILLYDLSVRLAYERLDTFTVQVAGQAALPKLCMEHSSFHSVVAAAAITAFACR